VLAMILRFVPYIGALLAAVLPLTLAAAVDADWRMVIWTIALFTFIELVMGQVIEPFIYGRSAGLSPVAIVISAAFWTWLWGPLGLLMSTPLTLCLAVLARHVDRLQFIDIMLGDQPALTPQQAAYQRMLTGDPVEAIEQARAFLKEGTVLAYYDEILVGALRLAQADAEQGRLDDARLENIFKTVSDTVEDLAEHRSGETSNEKPNEHASTADNVVSLSRGDFGRQVFCIPGFCIPGLGPVGRLCSARGHGRAETAGDRRPRRGCHDGDREQYNDFAFATWKTFQRRGEIMPSVDFPEARPPPALRCVFWRDRRGLVPIPRRITPRPGR
jgi:hypothetical protein